MMEAQIIQKYFNEIEENFGNIEILNFTKNFGHQSAILAGLKEFKADLYLVMDTDMQHDPNLIEVMLHNLEKSNSQIVQMSKDYSDYEPIFKRTFSKFLLSYFQRSLKLI